MENYKLKSSQELPDPLSPINSFNQSNTFVVNNTAYNMELILAYLTNPNNGLAIEHTVETNALIWGQGDCIYRCFEISDTLQTQLPNLSVTHDVRERTIIDIWEPKSDGLCNYKVTRKQPCVFIVVKMVLKSGRIVAGVDRGLEGHRRKKDKRTSRKIGLVLDDTVNIKKYNNNNK